MPARDRDDSAGHASPTGAADPQSAYTRREMITATGTGLAGGALALGTADAENEPSRLVNDDEVWLGTAGRVIRGLIERLDGPSAFVIRSPEHGLPVRVELVSTAEVFREGPAVLGDFHPGEAVVAEGRQDDQRFLATTLELLYDTFETTVRAPGGDQVETDNGTILISRNTQRRGGPALGKQTVAREPRDLRAGDRIVVSGRHDPPSGSVVAVAFGVVASRP